ncbi:MAG TPA: ABC transporter ATP-binding protein [Thermoplasmatales archaeon]|nr:ABC transporter ATP-binding protein [Thermoplasmatales archaeon]
MIEIRDLRKSYGKTEALKGISFEVGDGEAFAFLGPNGAGKTTTIKIMMGFLRPDSGTVRMFGKDISVYGKEVRKKVGFLPEEIGFYENLSVYDNMDFYARLFGIPKLERSKVINEILDQVGLSDRKRSKVKELSHGLKQRLGIAQSLINHPDLLIYDEPTSGLDPRSSYEIRELIKSLLKGGVTLFLSSHLLYEVQQICDGVAIIDKGRLVKRGKIKDLIKEIEGHLIRAKITCLNLDAEIVDSVKKIDGVKVIDSKDKTILVEAKDEEMIANINSRLVKMGGKVSKIEYISPDLEQVFLKLTGDNK